MHPIWNSYGARSLPRSSRSGSGSVRLIGWSRSPPGAPRRAALGPDADPRWIAAALLHDVGKTETRLGPFGRSAATVIAAVGGHRRVRRWSNPVGRYVDHDELGAQLLQAAGARPEAVIWARTHHRSDLWSTATVPLVPLPVCKILALADGEAVQQ